MSLGHSEAWKPQNVGGCGWIRCPRNRILSHVAQDTVRAWFRGVGAYCAVFGAFWHLFGPFLGHIVELKGTRGLFDTVKSSRTWIRPLISFVSAFRPGLGAILGEKWLFLAQNSADLGGHLPTWRHRPGRPLGGGLAKSKFRAKNSAVAARGGGAKSGRALPNLRSFGPKTAIFRPKQPQNLGETPKRRDTVSTPHVRLHFTV